MDIDIFILYNLSFIGCIYIFSFISTFFYMRKWGSSIKEAIFCSLKFVGFLFLTTLVLFFPFAIIFILQGVCK